MQPEKHKTVGVIGGMGPDATVDFMAKVIAATKAERDQDHIHMVVDCNPQVPDRQQSISGTGPDPGPAMARMAQRLETAGADFLVMPCNTAHAFSEHITDAVSIPLLSIIDVCIVECDDFKRIGLLTTKGCLQSQVYQQVAARTGKELVLPSADEVDLMTALVYRIKSGEKGSAVKLATSDLASALVARGAEVIIAACTEFPLVLDESMLDVPLVSSTDALARQTVAYACGHLKF